MHGGWHTPGSPRLSPVTPPANSRPTGFRQTALSPEADLFRCLAQGEDATSAPTFLRACAFPDTLTTEKPVLETSDAEMKESPALGRVTMCLGQPEEHNTLRRTGFRKGRLIYCHQQDGIIVLILGFHTLFPFTPTIL